MLEKKSKTCQYYHCIGHKYSRGSPSVAYPQYVFLTVYELHRRFLFKHISLHFLKENDIMCPKSTEKISNVYPDNVMKSKFISAVQDKICLNV